MESPTETRLEISGDSREWSENSLEEVLSGLDQSASSPVTPESDRIHEALSFGNGSSDVSPNHESESSYSELDSEAEAFYSSLNHQLVSSGTMDSHEKPMSYSELVKKLGQYEEEVRIKSLKLQESEQEIENLKSESEKRDSELEAARREIEAKDTDIESEKRRGLELQGQVVDLESQLSELRFNVGNVVDELHVSKECLAASDAEISKLKQKFSTEKTKLESDVSCLLEKLTLLEDQINLSDAEKMEMEAEINALKTDLASRDDHMEALNKDFDNHKLMYDMLMTEKDGVYAEVDNLKAEMRTRDIQIKQMEEQLNQLVYRQTELMSESGDAKNTVEELREMVKELEKQAELQRNAISEGEDEKREAIRQLCYSLDHYKTGYRQLLRFLSSNKKAVTVV